MSVGNLNVSLFMGAHHQLQQFRSEFPTVTSQLLAGDKKILDEAIINNAVIPVLSECEVCLGPTTDWDEYGVRIQDIIHKELKKSNQKELDLNGIAGMITKSILDSHKTHLRSTLVRRDKRENTIRVNEYINEGNRLLLSFAGSFEVTEKSKTVFGKNWNICIKGELEIKFLYLNHGVLGNLEGFLKKLPKETLERKKAIIFSGYLEE